MEECILNVSMSLLNMTAIPQSSFECQSFVRIELLPNLWVCKASITSCERMSKQKILNSLGFDYGDPMILTFCRFRVLCQWCSLSSYRISYCFLTKNFSNSSLFLYLEREVFQADKDCFFSSQQ